MAGTTTLILGGGFGGLVAANRLRALLPAEHKIVLVDKTDSFHLGASKTWVMLGERTPEQVSRTREALKRRGIEVRQADIERIDVASRTVKTTQGDLRGDYLVIALGADYHMGAVEGLAEAAQTFYTLEGAVRLRDTLKEFRGGDVVLLVPRGPFKCPPAPYEGAMLLHHFFHLRGALDRTRLSLYTFEGAPMMTAGAAMGQFIQDELAKRNIAFHPQKRTRSVDPAQRVVRFEDGSETRYDLLIAVPPHEAPRAARDSGLTNPSGWIPADPKTLKLASGDTDRVFAIGDVTVIPLPGRYRPDAPLVLPKAGTFAEGHGKVVAAQIAARVLGKEPKEVYGGQGYCYIEMGDRHAVRGDGSFYDMPHPTMSRRVPDMTQYEEKLEWARKWMGTNL